MPPLPPTTTPWSTFYPACLSQLPGVPLAMLDHWLRYISIDFCDRTKTWIVDLPAIDTVLGQMPYAITPASGQVLVDLRSVFYQGASLVPKSPLFLEEKYGDWMAETGNPQFYTQQSSDDVQVVPAPTAAVPGALKLKISVRPADDATGLDNWIYVGWNKQIVAGVKGNLMVMDKKPWTNPQLGSGYLKQYEDAILAATSSASRGQVRSMPRSKPVFA